MPRYELLIESHFSAAHRLRMHDGRFEPLHGHNWKVEVFVEGARLDGCDLLADFVPLQAALAHVTAELHDSYLNELPAFAASNPSAERVARHLHDRLAPLLPVDVRLTRVRVWESPGCAAAYLPDPTAA